MLKSFVQLLLLFIFSSSVYAHENVNDTIPVNVDSIEREVDNILNLLDSLKQPKSYLQVGIGGSNMQYSVNNTALNAQQVKKNFNLTPVVSYYHKSGWGIAYKGFILLEKNNPSFYQHTITPSYDYETGKKFGAGISYSRYFKSNQQNTPASPYNNDFYGYAEYKKWKIKPSLSFGFANGKISQYSQTDTFAVIKRFLRPDTTVYFKQYDTLHIKLRDYTMVAAVRSRFTFDGFTTKDYFVLSPSAMAYFGMSDYDMEYISKSKLTPELIQYFRTHIFDARKFAKQFPVFGDSRNYYDTGKFNLQSIGINIDASWYIGKFYFNPQVYVDYYLLSSKNKLSTWFTASCGLIL